MILPSVSLVRCSVDWSSDVAMTHARLLQRIAQLNRAREIRWRGRRKGLSFLQIPWQPPNNNDHVTYCNMAEILPVEIETADSSWLQGKTREELRHHVLAEAQRPLVLRRCTDSWTEARSWSPLAVCRILGDKSTTFKVCPRRGTDVFRQKFSEREVIFETQCEHVQASFLNFAEWLEKSENEALSALEEDAEPHPKKLKSEENSPSLSLPSSSNPLLSFPPSQYWVYADYKYMCQLCEDRPELIRAIDWGVLGFTGRGGAESTMWVGSQESCTPCHYDTYGCNLVAQLWGRKKWTLFSPDDSPQLYPTRIPYEESSVFSEVNVEHPDLEQYPNFASATGYQVGRSGPS